MMARVTRHVGTDEFTVQVPDGRRFAVLEHTSMIDAGSHDGPGEIRGLRELRTADGLAVNVRGDGTYEIVALGLTARRVP
jgi:hypothetical protein